MLSMFSTEIKVWLMLALAEVTRKGHRVEFCVHWVTSEGVKGVGWVMEEAEWGSQAFNSSHKDL